MLATTACAYLGDLSPEVFARFVATRIRAVQWPGEPPRYDKKLLDQWVDQGAPHVAPRSDAEWLAELEK